LTLLKLKNVIRN